MNTLLCLGGPLSGFIYEAPGRRLDAACLDPETGEPRNYRYRLAELCVDGVGRLKFWIPAEVHRDDVAAFIMRTLVERAHDKSQTHPPGGAR